LDFLRIAIFEFWIFTAASDDRKILRGNDMELIVSIIYYCLVGFVSVLLIYNLIKTKEWQKEVLYIIVLIPFLLRLFMLK